MCQCNSRHHEHHGHYWNGECSCSVMIPVKEEIEKLEEHKRMLKEKLTGIDKKLEELKSIV